MRIVDFRTFPDGSEPRNALMEAFSGLDLGVGEQTTPIENDTPIGVGYPQEWADDQVEEHAAALRDELASRIGDGVAVRYILHDAGSVGETADHLE